MEARLYLQARADVRSGKDIDERTEYHDMVDEFDVGLVRDRMAGVV